jgi:uncharacterized protein involved in type VI secretion and phage assembly
MQAGGPAKDSLGNLYYGVHYGIVAQNKDPDNLNRIKVRFPWLDQGDQDESYWAQLLTPMEGKKFGWYTLPDIDDVVAIMFVAGEMSQPVVLGGIWSKVDVSPETNEDGKNNFRGYRSRAGHRLILDDTPDGTKVVLADKTGKNMFGMGKFTKAGAGPNVCAIYKPPMSGDTGVSFSSMEGTFELTCKDGKLSITAQQNIKINAKTTIDVKAGQDIKMDGSSTAKVTAGSPSNWDGAQIKIG